ncbi:energy transducer TonB [Aureibacter tunicatorum]|uniref:Protein TonB n=1 Tax=Aureibacter tunicatorum TaxID=866807 RepID=A0AAE3XJ05_9BACT|nr:energy transducer TonB [Aureibacter tunicatorum]MDR6237737.1 protein TonB [Aureibacter tunicatorum]BDD02772.1 protein TonB [Aureibacter tunicatorum]
MESKKNPNADLEPKTGFFGLFFNIGLVISLALVLTAFEWKFYDDVNVAELAPVDEIAEEVIDIPQTTQPPPPPPPKVQTPKIVEVPDEEEIEEEIEVDLDVEIEEDAEIEEVILEEAPVEEEVDEIFTIVENQPEFPGGMAAFYKEVSKKMKYPSAARRMGVQGRVFVQFVVDTDGSITEAQVMKGIGSGCDEEALRVLNEISKKKKFSPGKQRGRAVKVRMVLPIIFKLS